MNKITETVGENKAPERIDVFTSEIAAVTRSRAAALIADGCVTVNGKKASKSDKVKAGDTVTVTVPEPAVYDITPENIPLDIVYEDGDLLVVNKPKGMVVHPAAGNYSGTLVNALMFHCGSSLSGINGVMRPGIVHRIDKNTSGLLMVAKNDSGAYISRRADKGSLLYAGIPRGGLRRLSYRQRHGGRAYRQTPRKAQADGGGCRRQKCCYALQRYRTV